MPFTLLEPSSINSTATFSFANLTVSGSIALTGANSNNNLGNAVTANYFIGNGALLTNISSSNITGQVPNALIAGTIYTNAQPNITSVGTLSSLSVSGNITSNNASLGNLTTSNYFSGNGSLVTSITGANVTGQVSNSLITGTVYTNAQPNITSVGTLTSLSVSGYADFTDTTTFRSSQDVTISGTPSGTVNYDLYNGTLFDVSPTANWTANVANIPTTNNRTTVVIFIITQGSTAYVPNVFQISGSTQTVKWLSSTTPSGTSNKIDVISYSLVRSNSGTWTVLGQSATYG